MTARSYSGIPGAPGADFAWDDANIPAEELTWLKADLAAKKLPTIVLTHQPLNRLEQVDPAYTTAHTVRNAADARAILEKSGVVIAVFSGHYHEGGFQQVGDISYVTLKANVVHGCCVPYHNQYATVDVYKDGKEYQVVVAGHGGMRDYVFSTVLP